jgi:hypothetical protein
MELRLSLVKKSMYRESAVLLSTFYLIILLCKARFIIQMNGHVYGQHVNIHFINELDAANLFRVCLATPPN